MATAPIEYTALEQRIETLEAALVDNLPCFREVLNEAHWNEHTGDMTLTEDQAAIIRKATVELMVVLNPPPETSMAEDIDMMFENEAERANYGKKND